jgi:hypothetical protein
MKKQELKKKILLEAGSDGNISSLEISGTLEDLGYLIAVAIDEVPNFIEVLKLALKFTEHQEEKKSLLQKAYDFCNDNDKSTEFMLQYMQDFADVDLDDVISFLKEENIFIEEKLKK